jgi:hypothetical protein
VSIRTVKALLLSLGAAIAIIGILLIQGSLQTLSERQQSAKNQVTLDNAILDRMRDYRRQYMSAIEIVPLMIETAPEDLRSRSGRAAARITVDRIGVMKLFACMSADTTSITESALQQRCNDLVHPTVFPGFGQLQRREDLYSYRIQAFRVTFPYNQRFFDGKRTLETDVQRLQNESGSLEATIHRLQSWQLVVTVVGIIVALGKDLLG